MWVRVYSCDAWSMWVRVYSCECMCVRDLCESECTAVSAWSMWVWVYSCECMISVCESGCTAVSAWSMWVRVYSCECMINVSPSVQLWVHDLCESECTAVSAWSMWVWVYSCECMIYVSPSVQLWVHDQCVQCECMIYGVRVQLWVHDQCESECTAVCMIMWVCTAVTWSRVYSCVCMINVSLGVQCYIAYSRVYNLFRACLFLTRRWVLLWNVSRCNEISLNSETKLYMYASNLVSCDTCIIILHAGYKVNHRSWDKVSWYYNLYWWHNFALFKLLYC